MHGQYSTAVYNRERVMMARVQYLSKGSNELLFNTFIITQANRQYKELFYVTWENSMSASTLSKAKSIDSNFILMSLVFKHENE